MDRELTLEERRKIRNRKLIKIAIPLVAVVAVIVVVILSMGRSVYEDDLMLSMAQRGDIEISVEANGKVVPAYEETVVSPLGSRILEIYCREGDKVDSGQPLLRLDLQSAEAEMRRMGHELAIREYSTRQSDLTGKTLLTNLEMKIKAKEMAVAELCAEMENERRLDSLGSGTGDRVRQADLAYRTSLLELEQLRKELANERSALEAVHKTKRLEESVTSSNLEMLRNTLDNAGVKAPHTATVTYIQQSIGTSINPGEKLAVLADLTRFKIMAEIPEGESHRVAPGATALVRIGTDLIRGTVTQINPQAVNGVISFTVRLDDESHESLKAGLRTNVSVIYDIMPNVLHIRNGPYYQGPGSYTMFVRTAQNRLESRVLILGQSNYDQVEVRNGLRPAESVVINDMGNYSKYNSLKIIKKRK